MAPNDFGLNPSAPSSPSDGMTRKSLLLSEEAALAQDSAMDLLSRSMASQREISPSQGIAAALLAAIPTLGGYLIGKSVGTTSLPSGLTNLDPSKLNPTGGYVGGLAGSQIGANASKDYTGAIETDNLHKQKVLAAEAQIENDRAQQLRQQANTVENAALNIDAQIAMLPIELQQHAKIQAIARDEQVRAHRAMRDYDVQNPIEGRTLSPQAQALAEQLLGKDASGASPQELNILNNIAREKRLAEAQDTKLSGEAMMPPSANTKKKLDSVLLTKSIGERYLGQLQTIAKQDPNYLQRNIEKVLPATEIGALQQALGLYAVQIRNARENGVMTETDFERYSNYLTITGLDTLGSVLGRMQELQAVTDLSAQATLTAAKAGQENVSNYEKLLGFTAPETLGRPFGGTQDSSGKAPTKTYEQILAEKRAKYGLK